MTATGQGQVANQYADSVLHASLQEQTPDKAIEDGEAPDQEQETAEREDQPGVKIKKAWAEGKQRLQKVTKAMADLSNEAQTILGALALAWQVSSRLSRNRWVCSSQRRWRP